MNQESPGKHGDELNADSAQRAQATPSSMQSPPPGATVDEGQDRVSTFEVWKKYEDIASHFNDLIIRLRVQALGGVAVLATIASLIARESGLGDMRWSMLAIGFLVLDIFWFAVFFLDFFITHDSCTGPSRRFVSSRNRENLNNPARDLTSA